MVNPKNKLLVINQPPILDEIMNRKAYRKPQLEDLGDLRTLTLGGSPGRLDSGGTLNTKPPMSLPQPGDFPIFNPDGTLRDPNDPIPTP
jgi:hypothetical protein